MKTNTITRSDPGSISPAGPAGADLPLVFMLAHPVATAILAMSPLP